MPKETIYYDKVRPIEVDFENIVHHATYLIWCENSRFNFFENIVGTPIEKFQSNKNIDIVILESNVKYIKSLSLGDKYYIKSRIEKINNLKFKFIDYVYDSKDKICAKGEFIAIGIDSINKKPVRNLVNQLEEYFSSNFSNEDNSVRG
jgi:YbgC/YbaW family acyl-CoA thioester hydrolase